MLSTGDHGELIICGWLAMSDPNAPPATNAVPLTSNRTGLRMAWAAATLAMRPRRTSG